MEHFLNSFNQHVACTWVVDFLNLLYLKVLHCSHQTLNLRIQTYRIRKMQQPPDIHLKYMNKKQQQLDHCGFSLDKICVCSLISYRNYCVRNFSPMHFIYIFIRNFKKALQLTKISILLFVEDQEKLLEKSRPF